MMASDNPDSKADMAQQESEARQLQALVRHNDRIIELGRSQINHVFLVSSKLQQGLSIQKADDDPAIPTKDIPSVSANSIKALSVQLNKLRIMELRIRIDSLSKTVEHVNKKNAQVAQECKSIEDQLVLAKEKIPLIHEALLQKHLQFLKGLEDLINDYQINKIGHIQRQSIKSQQLVFEILKEAVFLRTREGTLLFHNQPILKLSSFLNTNILFVNQFLENLITLQRHLSFLFNVGLPHLKDLVGLLPNSKFYNLIREKEILMTGKTDDDETEEKDKEHTPPPVLNSENVIKLGDAIKLPLSSKTINNQRRAQLLKQEPEIPIVKEDSMSPPRISEKLGGTTGPARKMIIIPHRILNKPFSKLSIKEFLRFLVVVAKLISNFIVFLKTVNSDYNDRIENNLDFAAILEQINSPNAILIGHRPEQDLADSLNLKYLMEQIYTRLISPTSKDRRALVPPSALQDLNVSALIANQTKLQSDDWDVVSKME
ncbi:uncharacterized protein CANTADRAFT_5795 [Suhomyces tanzawaensis NRRL Y-17324]|uniref:Uncharacterized protein n=1 Tax=Suhomyces tanzawaensis NRRL Y-17324 TaxID=984487 RepID=A0A1E4SKU5_9ASCO|nr:uncharacterized protein CANTADRAFT_5795 [Suhomyces tanzawaensis NRRL Y-17324]ODV80126.1 hypothetical protein CANTADRAFT_5795 [Suhomyces tanzawaensis NRRL Y-17324]